MPGWESFDPAKEVIHCLKPGTGCNDAPRCFSLKLAKVTQEICKMTPCITDNELCILHKDGKLVALMAKHVDDLKITGDAEVVNKLISAIQKVFGELKLEKNNFKNCGIRHKQDPITKEVTMDQDEYIIGITPILHPDISGKPADAECSPELLQLYQSVLGAIAFANLTRVDIMVFVSALQRVAHKPTHLHCKRLNGVVRWAQRNPKQLVYRRLVITNEAGKESRLVSCDSHLRMYSDAAFTKDEEDGRSMRGAVFIRCAGREPEHFNGSTTGHLIDFQGRSQRKVVRATFTAELLGGCDTVDHGLLLAQCLHHICTGIATAREGKVLLENGGYQVPMVLYLDAMGVYASITQSFQKTPADQSVLIHCLYIRQLLTDGVLSALSWVDTRDMHADGLTKGSVDRKALHDIMKGTISQNQEIKIFIPKGNAALQGVSGDDDEMKFWPQDTSAAVVFHDNCELQL